MADLKRDPVGGSVGRFRIVFTRLSRPYGVPYPQDYEYTATVDVHAPVVATIEGKETLIEDVPRPAHGKPWEGELTAAELRYVLSLPGAGSVNVGYRFGVEALDPQAKASLAATLGVDGVANWPPAADAPRAGS
jgi:hypothetical protein